MNEHVRLHVVFKFWAFRDYYLTDSLTTWQVTCRTLISGGLILANLVTGLKRFAVLVTRGMSIHREWKCPRVLQQNVRIVAGSWQGLHCVYHIAEHLLSTSKMYAVLVIFLWMCVPGTVNKKDPFKVMSKDIYPGCSEWYGCTAITQDMSDSSQVVMLTFKPLGHVFVVGRQTGRQQSSW